MTFLLVQSLNVIREKLQNFYKNRIPTTDCKVWNVGDMCAAIWHHDRCWYRGKIIGINSPSEAKVRLVDYGNEEDCSLGTISKEITLKDQPIVATRASIYGVKSVRA